MLFSYSTKVYGPVRLIYLIVAATGRWASDFEVAGDFGREDDGPIDGGPYVVGACLARYQFAEANERPPDSSHNFMRDRAIAKSSSGVCGFFVLLYCIVGHSFRAMLHILRC